MFLFLQILNGIPLLGNVQYKMKDGTQQMGHLVSSVEPKNSNNVYWINLGQVDTFISSKKPDLVIKNPLYYIDKSKDEELDIKYFVESTKTTRNKTIKTPKKFKNWRIKTMMKKRNFKRNYQGRI